MKSTTGIIAGVAIVLCVALGVHFLSSAQTVSIAAAGSMTTSERQTMLDGMASGNVIYGPAIFKEPTTTKRNIVVNHPLEPGTFGAVTVFNDSAVNNVSILQDVDGVAHSIGPGQTLAFPMRLENGRQIAVQFAAAGADNRVFWVVRRHQIRPTDL